MASAENIDWSDCALVETKTGVHSSEPVLRGTRMPVGAIVANFDYGVGIDEIAEQFEISGAEIEAIVAYAQAIELRILFDKNVPVGVRRFLTGP